MRFSVIAAALLAALLIAPLAGCGSGETDAQAEATPTAVVVPRPSAEASVTEAAPTRAAKGIADSACGADKLGRWLNALPTGDAMLDIGNTVGQRTIRYYQQGNPITQDFSPERLNVEIGQDGRIKRFRCG